jgi:hypothetical protein
MAVEYIMKPNTLDTTGESYRAQVVNGNLSPERCLTVRSAYDKSIPPHHRLRRCPNRPV